MRNIVFCTALVAAVAIGAGAASALTLTSPDIKPGGRMADEQAFDGFGCAGKNVSPELRWSGAPKGTKSFAVSVHDPDAPASGGFWHWWVANLPASVTSLPKGASASGLPAGAVQVRNDFGVMGYGGPCPPEGKPHHYQFTVYALDVEKLDVDANASSAVASSSAHAHTLAKATLIGVWGR